mgnify:CR=1 FL=1
MSECVNLSIMELGIIGLPKSGKTTLFNILTQGRAQTTAIASESQVGTARLPDERLEVLRSILIPKRVVPVEVQYIDALILKTKGGITGQLRARLGTADAFIHAVRSFPDASVPHLEGTVEPIRDIESMTLELNLSDLEILQRRLARMPELLKGAKGTERDSLLREQALLERMKAGIEDDVPIRCHVMTEDEAKVLRNYDFLSAKPIMVVLNIGEGQISQAAQLEATLTDRFPHLKVAAVCAKLENELAALGRAEAAEFRAAMGLAEDGVQQIVTMSYQVLDLVTFFTIASGEVRAWTVRRDTPAPRAAGKIHTDMERGFIRAEVVRYKDLVDSGGLPEAKKKGLVRLEGKNYAVQDGDVITFLFKV